MESAGEGRMALPAASMVRRTLRSFPWQRFARAMAAPRSIGEARLRMQRATKGQNRRLEPQRRVRRMLETQGRRIERLRHRVMSMEGCNVERYWCVLSRFTNSTLMCSYARRLQGGCAVEACRGAVLRGTANFRKQDRARRRAYMRKWVDCRHSRIKPRLNSGRKKLVSLRKGSSSGKRSSASARFAKARPAAA